jgi:hypothetical protein
MMLPIFFTTAAAVIAGFEKLFFAFFSCLISTLVGCDPVFDLKER